MLKLSSWSARFAPLTDIDDVSGWVGPMTRNYLEDEDLDWRLHRGDLIVPENVDQDLALVVDGNMIVHGFLDDYVSDIGLLVVLGDLVVHDLVSWGAVSVGGDLRAEGVVYAYYNDYTFEVGGKVHARALVLADKSGGYSTGEVEAEIDSYMPTKKQYRAARDIFVHQVYADGEERAQKGKPPKLDRPSYHRVCSRLHGGEPLFKTPAPAHEAHTVKS
ncbi:hypothetical protein [Kitasatospora sp. NBC_01266]|uniref:hypothetical protein n=1 Tax=Kitasatospora sp. NBC_01266 TaxID=2903572 RepID=UPI002E304CF7|nr:hypothetical protein [Kitasatospora sp. NBC_01266]